MAGRWCEGGESHRTTTQLTRKYAQQSGSFFTQPGRITGSSLGPGSNAVLVTKSLGVANTWILGLGFYVQQDENTLDSNAQGFYLERDTDEQVHIEFETNSTHFKVKLYRGSTLLDETGFDFDLNAWQFFELKVTIDPTNGSYEFRAGGVQQFSDAEVEQAW